MTRISQQTVFFLISVTTMIFAGCDKPVGVNAGIVQFADGSPVQSGSVELRNLKTKERYSSKIASNGGFKPASVDGQIGVPPGDYEAVVVQIVMTEDLAMADHTHGGTVKRQFADYYTSGLKVEVLEGATEPIQITVESQ
jgi:hypothetical protein